MKKDNGLEKIYSFIPNLVVKEEFTVKELKIIVYDHLQLTPMYLSLIEILKRKGFLNNDSSLTSDQNQTVQIHNVMAVLNSIEFL